ncbi:MAG: 16S rRNA processing protein RimM [Firmicutes bacterium]|nr:16S rRNA processing protein RimM [Bacillota bacterium]
MTVGSASPQRVAVAQVLAPHGVRGEVRVAVLGDDPGRLGSVRTCWLRLGDQVRPAAIVSARPGPRGSVIVAFEGVTDRDQAERLRGAWVEIPGEQVRPLPEGHFYLFQLMGLEVWTQDGRCLGRISGVLRSRAHDLWEVTPPAGGEPVLIPAVLAFVERVEPEAGRVLVRLPEGLVP